jgi:hypothetical protein
MLAAAIAVWGANAYRNLQIDTFPDVSPTQVVVSMLAPEPSRARRTDARPVLAASGAGQPRRGVPPRHPQARRVPPPRGRMVA